jgi:RecB family exonuclease
MVARTLVVCRSRAHQRARLRDGVEFDGAVVWAMPDLRERLCAWAALKARVARDDLGARVLAAQALVQAQAAGAVVSLHPRLAPATDALRVELVHAQTSAQALLDAIGGTAADPLSSGVDVDNLQGRAAEIVQLLTRVASVERTLAARGVVDDSLALMHAHALLGAGVRPSFLRDVDRVVVEDVVDATALELALFSVIAKAAPVTLRVPVDDVAGRAVSFGVDAVLKDIEGGGDHGVDVDVDPVSVCGQGPLAGFRAALFSSRAPDHPADAAPPVSLRMLGDGAAEARFVAAAAAGLWHGAEAAVAPRIAVAVRDANKTWTFIDALRLHGVPVRRRRRPLIESPAARLVLDLAHLRRDGAPRERLLAVLLSPARRGALLADEGARVLSTLRRAAARKDSEDRLRPTGGYRHRLTRLVDRDPDQGPAVERALAAIEPVLALAARLPHEAPLTVQLAAWLRVVGEIVDDSVGLGGSELKEIVARLAAAAARVDLKDTDPPVTLATAVRLVERECETQPWLDDDVDVDDRAIEVLSLPELCGRRFDHVIIARAVEGELPEGPSRASVINDGDRARLNQALGKRALRLAEHERLGDPSSTSLGLEGLWWLTALGAAGRSLIVTAPRVDVRGREHAPSAYLLDAARVLAPDGASRLLQTGALGAPLVLGKDRRAAVVDAVAALAPDPLLLPPLSAPGRGAGGEVSASHFDGAETVAAGPGDAVEVSAVAAAAARGRQMVAERARYFRDPTAPHAARRAAYAFAVSPARIARAFGDSFGLQASRPLTPTRLEALAECRMHGFVQHVLKLDVDVEPGNALEARVQGTLAHSVLERFYAERKERRVPIERMSKADRARLAALVDEEAAPLLAGRTTGHLAALSASIAFLKRTLLRVTTTLARRPPVAGVTPVSFELQIGARTRTRTGMRDPDAPAVPVVVDDRGRTIYLGGVIDRVDEGEGGRAVVDYKTMSASRVKEKAASSTLLQTHFQLLVYLRLLEATKPTHESVALHGHLISLKDGGTSKDVAEAMPELRQRVLDDSRDDGLGRAIGRVILPILEGTVPPDVNDRCVDCRLQRVCRVPQDGVYAIDPDEVADDVDGGASSSAGSGGGA